MEENFYLRMEAHNPERNHHRRYEFELGKDLFGIWTLIIRYGRVGKSGQSQTFSSDDRTELEKIIQSRIKRRAGAEKRIGRRYVICSQVQKPDQVNDLPTGIANQV